MTETIQKLAEFVVDTKFEDLPEEVAHAAKFLLLNSIGCGLASFTTDRGKMSIMLAKKWGAARVFNNWPWRQSV